MNYPFSVSGTVMAGLVAHRIPAKPAAASHKLASDRPDSLWFLMRAPMPRVLVSLSKGQPIFRHTT
jgi:hypothetical protein